MAQIQDKIVKSKYQPNNTNVIWVDTSGEKPVMKVFSGGQWIQISGGSSSVSVYHASGNASSVSELGLLDKDHEGFNYNMTEDFTTTADFVEGTGKEYPAGSNVVVVNVGTVQEPLYKYDVLGSSFEDVSFKEGEKVKDVDINDYVQQGSYSQSTRVGLADNLVSPIDIKDAFLLRPTATELGVSVDTINEVSNGLSYLNGVDGNAVAWNQLIKNGGFTDTSTWIASNNYSTITIENGIMTVVTDWSQGSDTTNWFGVYQNSSITIIKDHKYIVLAEVNTSNSSYNGSISFGSGFSSTISLRYIPTNQWVKVGKILTATNSITTYLYMRKGYMPAGTIDTTKYRSVKMIDLTVLCPEFADTLTDGETDVPKVERWLAKNIGTKRYYPDNVGTLLGVLYRGMTALKTANLLNPTTKTAKLFAYTYDNVSNKYTVDNLPTGANLYFTPDSTGVEEAVTMDDTTHFTVSGAGTLRVDTNDSVAETWLVAYWDGSMDSYDNYKPYQENSNVIDSRYVYYDNSGVKTKVWADGVMKATGQSDSAVKDRLYVDDNNGKWKADVKVGTRTYESGDESDTDVITDKTNTWYPLVTPIHHDTIYYSEDGDNFVEITLDNFPNDIVVNNWAYEESNVSPYDNGNPTSVAPVIEILYQYYMTEEIKTLKDEKLDIADLRGSMQNLVTTINTNCSTVLGGTLSIASETDASGHLQFEFTATE